MGIEIEKLEFEYEKFKLKIDELKIKEGSFHSLVGESGCGKTTLLRLIAGLEKTQSGRIIVDREDIGYIFQEPLLLPHLTVIENVCFGLKMTGMKKAKRKEIGRKYLKELKIEELENRYPNEISGGQEQRVAMARALVLEPKILLMDEPFSALDENLRENMRILIKEIHKIYSMTIVLVTHDLDEAFFVSDIISIMKLGKILQTGTVEEILKKPKTPEIANFLGFKNTFKAEIKNQKMNIDGANFSKTINKADGKYEVLFFPENFISTKSKDSAELIGQIDKTKRILYGQIIDVKSGSTNWQIFVDNRTKPEEIFQIKGWNCESSQIYFF